MRSAALARFSGRASSASRGRRPTAPPARSAGRTCTGSDSRCAARDKPGSCPPPAPRRSAAKAPPGKRRPRQCTPSSAHRGHELLLRGAVLHLELPCVVAVCAPRSFGSGRASRFSSLSSRSTALVVGLRPACSRVTSAVTTSHISLRTWSKASTSSKKSRQASGMPSSSFASRGQPFDLPHRVVSEKAHRAGGKGRHSRQPRRLVAAQRLPEHLKDVAFHRLGFLALGDGNLPPARHNALEGSQPDEGIAAHLLAAFNRFQQKALRLGQAARRKAETGVSRSAVRTRQTGTNVCSRASARNSLRLGCTDGMAVFTGSV